MNFKIYQEQAVCTAIFPKDNQLIALSYTILGLTNESGEVAGKFKKIIRDKNGNIDTESINQLRDELGDVLWYIANTCELLGITIEDIASRNIDKLLDRKRRNVLTGDGDNR